MVAVLASVANSPSWTEVVSTAIALLSLCLAAGALIISLRAFRLTAKQEARRQPKLEIHLVDSWATREKGRSKAYWFELIVKNPTDADNTIATAELWISYTIQDGIVMTAKLPLSENGQESADVASVPLRVPTHGAIRGRFKFETGIGAIAEAAVESYRIVLEDSHGFASEVVPIIIGMHSGRVDVRS